MSMLDRIQRYKGCRYPDTLPDGRTARVWWGHQVITMGELVGFPPGATAFDCLRIGPHGEVAGTANVGGIDRAFLWDGAWHDLGPAFGRNAVAFDHGVKLLCVCDDADGGEMYMLPSLVPGGRFLSSLGPLGIRFITWNHNVITSANTYADAARGLYEYTDWGDCAIGQGGKPDQGVVVRFADDGILRRFVFGVCRDVRWERDGENIAVSWTQQDTDEACVWTGLLEELRTLPPVQASVPEPEPEPQPQPQPTEPTMSLLPTIQRVRAKYPTPLGHDGAGKVCNEVCTIHAAEGWGMVYKPAGTNWRERSTDVILNRNTGVGVDILGSSETDGVPVWNVLDPSVTPTLDRWRAPYPVEPVEQPGPVTPDPVTPPEQPDPGTPPWTPSQELNYVATVAGKFDRAITAFCQAWLGA